jgi:hypothetical protein
MASPVVTWFFRGLFWLLVGMLWAKLLYILYRGEFHKYRGRGPMIRRREQPQEFWLGVVFLGLMSPGVTALVAWMWLSRVGA